MQTAIIIQSPQYFIRGPDSLERIMWTWKLTDGAFPNNGLEFKRTDYKKRRWRSLELRKVKNWKSRTAGSFWWRQGVLKEAVSNTDDQEVKGWQENLSDGEWSKERSPQEWWGRGDDSVQTAPGLLSLVSSQAPLGKLSGTCWIPTAARRRVRCFAILV